MGIHDPRNALEALLRLSEESLRPYAWAALTLHVVLASERELTDRASAERRLSDLLRRLLGPNADEDRLPMRVLVVEDSDSIAQVIPRLLGPGFETVRATDGIAARESLATAGDTFDAVLSDVTMPRLDGFGLLRWAQAERPELLERLVFMTADPDLRAATLIALTHPVLRKPLTPAVLHAALGKIRRRG
jgi:CheY-like chemotaxis protein